MHGGDERARTADPLLAKQVLSQLSYIPGGGSNPTATSLYDDARSAHLPPRAALEPRVVKQALKA